MKYGVYLPNFGAFGDARFLARLAQEAEEAGWDGFFIWDHINRSFKTTVVDPWVALSAVALSVPCKVPLPALRAAVTTVLLSVLRRLPKVSWMRRTGCRANGTPAMAVLEGWVNRTSVLAEPGVTVSTPLTKLKV